MCAYLTTSAALLFTPLYVFYICSPRAEESLQQSYFDIYTLMNIC